MNVTLFEFIRDLTKDEFTYPSYMMSLTSRGMSLLIMIGTVSDTDEIDKILKNESERYVLVYLNAYTTTTTILIVRRSSVLGIL
jgi:hypothetical protein